MKWEKSGTFEQTAEFQHMYAEILFECDMQGSLVMQDRHLEKDRDIAPHHFYRKGTREYVFPKQYWEVSLQEDSSRIIEPSHNYVQHTEVQRYSVDESKVKGRLLIEYGDAGNVPELRVTDLLGNSELPKEVKKTLEDLFQ